MNPYAPPVNIEAPRRESEYVDAFQALGPAVTAAIIVSVALSAVLGLIHGDMSQPVKFAAVVGIATVLGTVALASLAFFIISVAAYFGNAGPAGRRFAVRLGVPSAFVLMALCILLKVAS